MVHIFETTAVMHNTGWVRAVLQSEGVPQLMEGLFDHPVQKDGVGVCLGQSVDEAVGGYHCRPAAHLGLAKDMGQDGDKQVNIGNGQDFAVVF